MRIWEYLGWLTLIVQIIAVVLAIRLYRAKRTRPFAFLMASIICIAVADSVPPTFGFISGLIGIEPQSAQSSTLHSWTEYTGLVFTWLSLVLLLLALISFLRAHRESATPTV